MKNYYFILIFIYSVCAAQVPTAGLISQWPFSGNANDVVGGNNGTVFNATPSTDRFGNPNCAYNFNGFSSYIVMANAGPTGAAPRTISLWGKTNNTSLSAMFAYGGAPDAYAIQLSYNCTGVGYDNGAGAFTMSNANVSNGSWHHYAAVFDSAANTQMSSIKFYVDGVLASTLACTIGTATNAAVNTNSLYPINIGKVADNFIRYFNGDLDDIYLYKRALSPSEVLALYNDVPCLAIPPSPGTISGNMAVCQGATYVYSVAPVPGATSYSWSLPGGWTGTSSTNTISVIAGTASGTVMVTTRNCCGTSQPSSMDVNVNQVASLTVSATQFTICKGNSTTLYGNGASTYTWNSIIISPSIAVSPTVTTTFTLNGTNSSGCSSATVATVNVSNNTLPVINVTGPGPSCTNQVVNLASNGASTYTWQPGGLTGFFVSVSPSVTTTYTITGTDANGCYNSATYTQTVSACTGINSLEIASQSFEIYPNPNSGVFILRISPSEKNSYIEIINQLGKLVYEKTAKPGETTIQSELPKGFYFVRLYTNGKLAGMRKLIIAAE